jgi:hypothetical protein
MDTINVPAMINKSGTNYGNIDVEPGKYLKIQTNLPLIHFDTEPGKLVSKIDMTNGTIFCKDVAFDLGSLTTVINGLKAQINALEQQLQKVPFHTHQLSATGSDINGSVSVFGMTSGPD